MYTVANEKSLRLVYGTFNLAILTEFVNFYEVVKPDIYKYIVVFK